MIMIDGQDFRCLCSIEFYLYALASSPIHIVFLSPPALVLSRAKQAKLRGECLGV
jgi:hypothetical protein